MKNKIVLNGCVTSAKKFGKMYWLTLETKRLSGTIDKATVLSKKLYTGFVKVCGQIRSKKNGLKCYVYASSIEPSDKGNKNEAMLEGYICEKPYCIKNGKLEVVALMLAINGKKTHYVPVVCWRNITAKVNKLKLGDKVLVKGKYQEREYSINGLRKTANEVSAYHIASMI